MNSSPRHTRRTFLGRSTAAGLGALSLPAVFSRAGRVLAANDTPVMGIIGAGGRGRRVMQKHQTLGVTFAAVCDIYEPNLARGLEQAGPDAASHADYRELLAREDLDAVLIATPEHWHGRMLIDSVRAGKDAYCEKPMSHSIQEGVEMIRAVRETDRIVQIGMQRRSSPAVLEAKKLLARCGAIRHVKAYWNWDRSRPLNNKPLPGKIDWTAFLGPAPWRPFEPKRVRSWRFFWDYSGGACADQGTHLMDVVQWFMGTGAPRKATCMGELYDMKGAETPDVFSAVYEYPRFTGSWTLNYTNAMDNGWNIQFLGREGTLWLDNQGARLYAPEDRGSGFNRVGKHHLLEEIASPLTDEEHVRNFIECCRSRQEPNATVEIGHTAVCAPHLANVALREEAIVRLDADATKVSL